MSFQKGDKMDNQELEEVAYLMVAAYNKPQNMDAACQEIAEKCPGVEDDIIRGMWSAIDAYVDRSGME